MRLALYQPDIAQNTGTMLRTCACLGVDAHVIGPTGFDMSDRALRRAGLDYLEHVRLTRHASWAEFEAERQHLGGRLLLLTSHGDMSYTRHRFANDDIIMVGRESAGVPDAVARAADARLTIPMAGGMRSLNVAVAAGMVLGEALRQRGCAE
ncbi:MAG: tRNA (cytidine(34)-2'-O)-methyltransferase [Hyphomicrobiaceae bacterium]